MAARIEIHTKAPCRVDLAGGTLDIWPLYLFHERAQTLNAALSIRAYCSIQPRADTRIPCSSGSSSISSHIGPGAWGSSAFCGAHAAFPVFEPPTATKIRPAHSHKYTRARAALHVC